MSEWLPEESETPAVLVVDDNLVMVKQVIQVLTPHGINCHWAHSSSEAKRIVRLNRIDLVIADIRLPALNGIELATWLRAEECYRELPVLFFTAASDRATIEEAARIPNVDYLLRPLRPAQFCERVLKHIRSVEQG
ncbi:MAG: response regulator [Planctomycetota bacterium]